MAAPAELPPDAAVYNNATAGHPQPMMAQGTMPLDQQTLMTQQMMMQQNMMMQQQMQQQSQMMAFQQANMGMAQTVMDRVTKAAAAKQWRRESQTVKCDKCDETVETQITYERGGYANSHLIIFLIFFCCFPLALVALCCHCCHDVKHHCPRCNRVMGTSTAASYHRKRRIHIR